MKNVALPVWSASTFFTYRPSIRQQRKAARQRHITEQIISKNSRRERSRLEEIMMNHLKDTIFPL
ncbi:hypothetical protein A1OQ_09300 [Enterovibrio norvegicus FF-162]|uniref:hypothetical protein n=1 Tax=Enterovibrio norvegicus TaxID=188144 RepID=UPI00030FB75C|nr:hypothetical protein [Enterovibrio norvegicus]OEE74372.1 hypothetical protein A1OQ_09300 [Enterovibrio norvegicus FF-162]